jgi:hypothetical protein
LLHKLRRAMVRPGREQLQGMLGTHQGAVSVAHLDYYLDEYTFRFNRRTSGSRGLVFLRLIQQAVDIGPVPANKIPGGRRPTKIN